jgi:hypothetical protein
MNAKWEKQWQKQCFQIFGVWQEADNIVFGTKTRVC